MKKPPFRVGLGTDIHQFAEGRKLILGGVEIPSSAGLLGHSDADVLTHAIMDALLGAAGEPDIGHFFPNTELEWKGASSLLMLQKVVHHIASLGWEIGNIDVSLLCQAPKLASFLPEMKEKLSEVLSISPSQIGIKVSTPEKLGSLGRGEGMFAQAVCLLLPL